MIYSQALLNWKGMIDDYILKDCLFYKDGSGPLLPTGSFSKQGVVYLH